MIFVKKFEEFDFYGLKDFIFDLVENHNFWGIRFYPRGKEHLFSEQQLTHAAPHKDITNPEGFIWAWVQKRNEVRQISFAFSTLDERASIQMSIDLDKKFISLDRARGISIGLVEEIFNRNFGFPIRNEGKIKLTTVIKKPLSIIIEIMVGLIIIYIAYKLGWNR